MSATVTMDVSHGHEPAIARRYETLIRTHRELKDQIGREKARPAMNSIAMQELKRRKLRIKDAIAAIERSSDALSVVPGKGQR